MPECFEERQTPTKDSFAQSYSFGHQQDSQHSLSHHYQSQASPTPFSPEQFQPLPPQQQQQAFPQASHYQSQAPPTPFPPQQFQNQAPPTPFPPQQFQSQAPPNPYLPAQFQSLPPQEQQRQQQHQQAFPQANGYDDLHCFHQSSGGHQNANNSFDLTQSPPQQTQAQQISNIFDQQQSSRPCDPRPSNPASVQLITPPRLPMPVQAHHSFSFADLKNPPKKKEETKVPLSLL
jgi:hypothetical protein